MPTPNTAQYFERLPYHERLASHLNVGAALSREVDQAPALIFPDIPDDLIEASDRLVTAADWERLHGDAPGDAMSGYAYGSQARLDFLAAERAATRLGVVGMERLEPATVAALRAAQAIGAATLRAAGNNRLT